MLISGIGDENEESREGPGLEEVPGQQEYQTASELFDLMTKNQPFDTNDEDTLTTQDLVLLYQNIDIGNKLMSSANERKKPNQHVETVVYNEDSDSDSEASIDDLSSLFEINQERLNIFANRSLDNILCHKLGGLKIKTSDLTTDYDRQFFFKDPYIKEQLKGLGNLGDLQSVVPTSLLDYICCKRLEDNYNFYMDNIIRYVQRTIEQLKRISNGDFLTERAKEKWKEVNGNDNQSKKTKVLSNSTSIPLHVECKKKGNAKWDDIIHSEVDVRSLSKILEKKIVVEIPKLICGSYRVFSKSCADNLIISCKRGKENNNEKKSRVDVVVQLQKSETGQVMSNISSIMILQTSPDVQEVFTPRPPEILPLPYKEKHDTEEFDANTNDIRPIESSDNVTENYIDLSYDDDSQTQEDVIISEDDIKQEQAKSEKVSGILSSDECLASFKSSWDPNNRYSSESSIRTNELTEEPSLERTEASFIFTSPDELRMAMRRLNMQTVLSEESGEELSPNRLLKKKSPTRVRIKSPYENKSFVVEERKRKKLLEIRDKRERKKQALGENCKISKNKHIKVNVPQPASSVTKLSITNKSFYNSIYGKNLNVENKSIKTKNKRINNNVKKDSPLALEVPVEQIQDEYETPNLTPDMNSKKFINRSYYLDEAETEMMYIQKKHDENKEMKTGSASTSTVSNDFHSNINLLTELIGPSDTSGAKVLNVTSCRETQDETDQKKIVHNEHTDLKPNTISNKTPENTPKNDVGNISEPKSVTSTVECRKSIEKVYDLMKKLSKSNTELKIRRSKQIIANGNPEVAGGYNSQGSDSGTSMKHQLTSSNPSSFSFDKLASVHQKLKTCNKNPGQSASVVPKVIISSKFQGYRPDTDKIRKDHKKSTSPKSPHLRGDHPLKTITQLLNQLEKTKHKPTPDKIPKTVNVAPNDLRNLNHGTKEVTFRRKSRIDHLVNTTKDNEQDRNKGLMPSREKKTKHSPPKTTTIPHQQIPIDDKKIERITKKKLTEIIDEAKEARGEAVRGPPKFSSRLYTLAQPKKCYVQAHNEEYQNRCGRNIMMADRLQRLASTSPISVDKRRIDNQYSTFKAKPKRAGAEGIGNAKPSNTVQTSDNCPRQKSNCNSPQSKSPVRPPTNYKRNGTESPEQRKKIWAVESYVMNHYGRRSRSPLTNELRIAGHKSRVPLMPKDIDIASITSCPNTEEANELGNKLHCMINSLVVSSSPLEALTESQETNTDGGLSVEGIRTDSDFNIDVLEDKYLQTAVGTCYDPKVRGTKITRDSWDPKVDLSPLSSKAELEQLENALYSHISGTFQKRLRIKNLTLTPKQSLQKVLLLKSGDTGTLVVKSLTKLNINKCVAEGFNDLKAIPVLSNSHLNWNFMEIPMQISTVGYSFPQKEPTDVDNLNIFSFEGRETTSQNCPLNHCQCFKEVHQQPGLEQTEKTYVEGHAAIVKATIGTNVDMNEERKLNEITSKDTPENRNKTDQNEITATKEEQVVLKTTEVMRKEGNELSKVNQCSVPASVSEKSTNPDYTSSLDMLVGLLNEIKKITGENHVSSSCSDLDVMLCNAENAENVGKGRELVSVASLDQLTKLGSNASIYSLYISNGEDLKPSSYSQDIPSDTRTEIDKPICVDKDVHVNIEKELVSAFTDVPSSFFPITVNHSTNVTNSLIGVISEPSSQSMFTYSEYHTLYSNKVFDSRSVKILEPISNGDISDASKFKLATENFNKTSIKTKKEKIMLPVRDICDHKLMKYDRTLTEFDPLLKVKRDILVTVYSILVFTVFAALSFPEMLLLTDV